MRAREAGGRGWSGRRVGAVLLLAALGTAPAAAQAWDDSTTLALVGRAIAARQRAEPDSTLRSYHTTAHGFVFFLGQAGRDLAAPPRLIKADELLVDVYWQAPDLHRQVIRGWRDGRWLPTDIHYHRDHLGIVTNNFGDRIRIGEGDEVRDVIHPLAPEGPGAYSYRLADSIEVRTQDGARRLHEVLVRPRDPSAPRVIGTLSLDATTGDLVRFRFSFTPAAYLDHSIEDLSVSLENARVEGRWWLPWRQELEIRRRLTWLDLPARSIIRGRWEIGEYELNTPVPQVARLGPAVGGLLAPADSTAAWDAPLATAIQEVATPVAQGDLDALRDEVAGLAAGQPLSGLARSRLGIPSISELIRVNRVQGLALGLGFRFALGAATTLQPRAAIGTADGRLTGGATLRLGRGATTATLTASRAITDVGDTPVVSGVVNSLLAQEGGRDMGDYVRLDQLGLAVSRRLGGSVASRVEATVAVERAGSVARAATPARGRYRPNPALGGGTSAVARLGLVLGATRLDREAGHRWEFRAEGGTGDRDYSRITAGVDLRQPGGPGILAVHLEGGAGSQGLPAHRSFALGGWGTLPGVGFRAIGGRRYGLGRLEYRLAAPAPAIPLGPYVSTGNRLVLAPFVAVGVAGGAVARVPWRATGWLQPVAGIAVELFHRLLRVETGISLRTGRVGLSVDVDREWWEIL